MNYEEFKKILKENNLSVKEFAKISETSYNTCNTWSKGSKKVPNWVSPFLRLYKENEILKNVNGGVVDHDCEKYKELAKAFQNLMNTDK